MSPDLLCQLQLAADGGGGEGGAVQRQQSLLDLHQQAVVGVEDLGGHLQYSTVSVQYSTVPVQENPGLEATLRKDSSLSVLSAGTRSRDCRSLPRVACSWASVNTWVENITTFSKKYFSGRYKYFVVSLPCRSYHSASAGAPPARTRTCCTASCWPGCRAPWGRGTAHSCGVVMSYLELTTIELSRYVELKLELTCS